MARPLVVCRRKGKLCECVSEEDTPLVLGICFVGDQTLCLALKLLHRGLGKPVVLGWGSFSIGYLASCGVFVVVVAVVVG